MLVGAQAGHDTIEVNVTLGGKQAVVTYTKVTDSPAMYDLMRNGYATTNEWEHEEIDTCDHSSPFLVSATYIFRFARTSCTTSGGWWTRDPSARKIWITYIQAYMPCELSEGKL